MDEVKTPETTVDASEQKSIEPQEKAGEKDVAKLQETKNTPENTSEIDEAEAKRIPSRNEHLEGETHPETGVPFEAKVVENSESEMVEVVAPEFDSDYDAQLPENLYQETDKKQFDECNSQLKEAVTEDPELAAKFDETQLEQIENGETPDGYVWHHDVKPGKMQLVDEETHIKTGHTGGKSIWGGGSENR
ncbi:MAG: HNH endonuclease [Oscillospiraceae bacterium]|jgi:uncharacterized phage infection (PIP) family protein YhgE|nr:HNH endonuclease [Oscillospiraceae bacterium]